MNEELLKEIIAKLEQINDRLSYMKKTVNSIGNILFTTFASVLAYCIFIYFKSCS